MVTTKRVSVFIICTFIIFIASVSAVYVVNSLGRKYFLNRNRTMLGLIYTQDREEFEEVSFLVNNTLFPFSALVAITLCTSTLVIQLHNKTKWRLKSTSSLQSETISSRNQKLAKMVVMISMIFIFCFVPISVLFLAMSVIPALSITGKYRNILTLTGGSWLCLTVHQLFYEHIYLLSHE